MQLIYNFSIALYGFLIKIASLFSTKAQLWLTGRKAQETVINELAVTKKSNLRIWLHCASLGEFEQGRPLIEYIKQNHQDIEIILTFFSPSGYEVRKNYPKADHIFYLPIDAPKKAEWFIKAIKADLVIFIKYEFWFNYIQALKKEGATILLVSGIFRKNQHFFKVYGSWFRKRLNQIDFFFLQNQESAKLLKNIGIDRFEVNGDTRFDQVFSIKNSNFQDEKIERFVKSEKVIVFGSSWNNEDQLALDLIESNQEVKIILAPHELNAPKTKHLLSLFKEKAQLYSELDSTNADQSNVLILDTMGLLSKVYRYADIAVIGGGFGKGIHNTIEAAVYGIPVIFGPKFKKYHEAVQMVNLGAAFSIHSKEEFSNTIQQLLQDKVFYKNAAQAAANYCDENIKASSKVLQYLKTTGVLK